jgi:hypothetical protein
LQHRAGLTSAAPVANEVTGGGAWAFFGRPRKRKPTGAFLWLSNRQITSLSQITNHLALTHGRMRIPTSHQRSDGMDERHLMGDGRNSDTRACRVCRRSACVLCFLSPYPERDLIPPCVSQVRIEKGAQFEHAFMIRSRGIPRIRSVRPLYEILGPFPLTRLLCSFGFIEGQKFCGGGGGWFIPRARRPDTRPR